MRGGGSAWARLRPRRAPLPRCVVDDRCRHRLGCGRRSADRGRDRNRRPRRPGRPRERGPGRRGAYRASRRARDRHRPRPSWPRWSRRGNLSGSPSTGSAGTTTLPALQSPSGVVGQAPSSARGIGSLIPLVWVGAQRAVSPDRPRAAWASAVSPPRRMIHPCVDRRHGPETGSEDGRAAPLSPAPPVSRPAVAMAVPQMVPPK